MNHNLQVLQRANHCMTIKYNSYVNKTSGT